LLAKFTSASARSWPVGITGKAEGGEKQMTIAAAVTALTDLGIVAVITVGALIFVAGKVYKRFRS